MSVYMSGKKSRRHGIHKACPCHSYTVEDLSAVGKVNI